MFGLRLFLASFALLLRPHIVLGAPLTEAVHIVLAAGHGYAAAGAVTLSATGAP